MKVPYGARSSAAHDRENNGKLDGLARSLRMDWDDLDWWLAVAPQLSWRFAHTMSDLPHSYVIRDKTLPTAEYLRAFGVIRTFGTPAMFNSRTQLYLNHPGALGKGIRWWLMSTHHWQSKAINQAIDGKLYGKQTAPDTSRPSDLTGERAPLPLYDSIGAFYDDLWREDTDRDRKVLWKLTIGDTELFQPTILDAGAGTGATLQAKLTRESNVTAIDPAQSMLNDLVVYHPSVGQVVNATVGEFLEAPPRKPWDLAVASAGSASYLTPEEMQALVSAARVRAVLTFYRTRPAVHEALGFELTDSAGQDWAEDNAASILDTEKFRYVVIEGGAR